MSNIRRQFKKRINEKQDSIVPMPAVIGDDTGNVYDADRNIYVRIAGQVQKIKNSDISPLYNQKVWVGYEPTQPNTFKILNERTSSGEGNVITPAKHAHTHEWMGHGVGGGTDVVKVQLGQFMPLRVMPYSGFKVLIYPGLIRVGTTFVLLADTNDAGKPIPKILDLEEHIYVASDKAAYVLVTIDTNGDIVTIKGDEKDIAILALTNIPDIPIGTQYVLAAVRVYSGMMEIQENREATDIVDLRFPMPHNHASDGIAEINWGSIDFAGSDLADLETKSHTELSDIGTNTHAEIDDFIIDLEAVGDLLYVKQTNLPVYNHALVASGASAVAISTYGSNPAANVIDENDTTVWAGASNPAADDWIYINLGQVRTITRFRMYQYPYGGSWGATSYKVQGSSNGSDWTDIVTITPSADDETITFATSQAYQYFRFYVVTGGEFSWQIYTIELLEDVVVKYGLERLPIGTEGQHLIVDDGIPAWEDDSGGDMDNPMTTAGDIIYGGSSGTPTRLAGGTEGHVLKMGATNPEWGAASGVSALNDLTDVDLTDLADGDVLVYDETSGDWLPETPSGGGSLTVEEADGTPSVGSVVKIKVTNGTLTDDGSGVVSLDFGSAATDGAAIHDNVNGEIHAITEETTPASGDEIIIESAANSYAKRRVQISNLPSGSGETDVLMVQVFS
jgi:hypothetical protein